MKWKSCVRYNVQEIRKGVMISKPLVTVVMPCYNHSKYVREAIESVLQQTYTEFEFLIADDGSTDDSAEIIKQFTDERIKFFEYDKNTCFRAWEELEHSARGKYITCIASDDVWRADKLEKQVAFLEENIEYEACFSWIETIDGDSRIIENESSISQNFNLEIGNSEEWFRRLFMASASLAAPSYMMKTNVYHQLGGFHFKYRQIQDYELWLRYLLNHKLAVLPEKLLYYRWHAKDETANISAPSTATLVRTFNEIHHMYSSIIEQIEDKLFIKTFYKQLLRKELNSHEEVMCEKFFLMINHPREEAQQSGIEYYLNHIDEKAFCMCLEELYSFTRADFHVIEANRGLMVKLCESNQMVEQYRELANTALSYVKALQAQGATE